jgi:hypothetical protein
VITLLPKVVGLLLLPQFRVLKVPSWNLGQEACYWHVFLFCVFPHFFQASVVALVKCNFQSSWYKALNDLHDLPSWVSVIDEAISIVHYAASKLSGERNALGSASRALAQSSDCISWRGSFLRHHAQIIHTHTYLGTCIKYTTWTQFSLSVQHSWCI